MRSALGSGRHPSFPVAVGERISPQPCRCRDLAVSRIKPRLSVVALVLMAAGCSRACRLARWLWRFLVRACPGARTGGRAAEGRDLEPIEPIGRKLSQRRVHRGQDSHGLDSSLSRDASSMHTLFPQHPAHVRLLSGRQGQLRGRPGRGRGGAQGVAGHGLHGTGDRAQVSRWAAVVRKRHRGAQARPTVSGKGHAVLAAFSV
jgi:hypothetical protein